MAGVANTKTNTKIKTRARAPKSPGPGRGRAPYVRLVAVTPALAAAWLLRNHPDNRRRRPWRVEEFADDMRHGRWTLSDQAVSFDRRGRLINGQHRLAAVVASGVTVTFVVLFCAPDRAMLVIDGGLKRSTDDRFGMAGRDHPRGCGATVRRALMGLADRAGRAYSDQAVDAFMARHGASVRFAHAHLPRGRYAQAPVRAVLARAHAAGTDPQKLARFAEALTTGIMGPGEHGAVLLRNHIIDLRDAAAGSGSARRRLYAAAEAAVVAVRDGVRPVRLVPVTAEQFPLPGEG